MTRGLVALALLSAFASGRALADDAHEEARRHVESAQQALASGDFLTALAEYEAARRLYPNPLLLLNIAQAQAELGRPASAIATLESFLAVEGVPDERRADALSEVARLHAHVGRLVVRVNVTDTIVRFDGRELGTVPRADPFLVDPGPGLLEASQPGYEPTRREITVAAGSETTVSLELRPARVVVPARTRRAAPVHLPVAPTPPDRTWAWVTGAGAVALALTGAVLGTLAVIRHDAFEEQDQSIPAEWDRANDLAGEVETLRTATDVVLGVAVVSAVASLLLFATSGSSLPEESRRVAIRF